MSENRPRLRAVEVIHLPGDDGRAMACLRDRLDPAAQPVIITQAGLLLASLLDGRRTVGEVRSAFLLRTGMPLPEKQIAQFVDQLDQAYLLDTPRFRLRMSGLRDEFRVAPTRAASHAGGAYPGDPATLIPFLDGFYLHPDGPGAAPAPPGSKPLRGLIAPHIDLHRGGPLYAWAYQALAESEPADLYLLLGTCHAGMRGTVAATRKSYDTPLGVVPTDEPFLDELQARFGEDLYQDEYQHRAEHSLEFQALYLRYLGHSGGAGPSRCIPILCNSPRALVGEGQSPRESPSIDAFVRALRDTISASGKRVCLIAGADLAHVGPQFGDPRPLTAADLTAVEAADREMLALACASDAEGFYRQVMREQDARRICGLGPIYMLLATLGEDAQGELLRYAQWVDSAGNGSVTYAAVAYRSDPA